MININYNFILILYNMNNLGFELIEDDDYKIDEYCPDEDDIVCLNLIEIEQRCIICNQIFYFPFNNYIEKTESCIKCTTEAIKKYNSIKYILKKKTKHKKKPF